MIEVMARRRPDFRVSNVVAVWLRHVTAFRRIWVVDMTAILMEPLFVLVGVGFGIGHFVDNISPGFTYQDFIAPGIIVGNAMFHAIFECSWGAYQRMRTHEIYDAIIAAPVNVGELAAGEVLWGATRAVMTTAAVLAAAAALGLIRSPLALFVLPVGFLTGLVFGGMGLNFAATARSSHSLMLVFTMIATPMFFFSGTFFPVDSLPGWLQPVAWALPLTPAVHAARGFTSGDVGLSQVYAILYLIGLSALFYPIATALLRRRLLV